LVVAKTIPHRRQRWAVGPDLAVAANARLGRRDTRERAVFNGCVAIAAVYPIVADVMLVAEGDRLAASDADLGYVGRFVNRRQRRHQGYQYKDTSEDAELGNGIGTGMEYLTHSISI